MRVHAGGVDVGVTHDGGALLVARAGGEFGGESVPRAVDVDVRQSRHLQGAAPTLLLVVPSDGTAASTVYISWRDSVSCLSKS